MDAVSAAAERPVYFAGPDGPLFGVVTSSPDPHGNVVICSGGWYGGSANSNRMLVRMARRIASGGRNVIRFDWHGAGESPGHLESFGLNTPFEGDALAAAARLDAVTQLQTSLVGICFGSRAVLAAAPAARDLEAIALVSFPFPAARTKQQRAERIGTMTALREGIRPSSLKGWMQPATRRVYLKFIKLKWRGLMRRLGFGPKRGHRASEIQQRVKAQTIDIEDLVRQLAALVDRRVRVLLVFGDSDAHYEHFTAAQDGSLGELLARAGDQIVVTAVEGDLSGFSSLESQATAIDIVAGWLDLSGRKAP